MSWQNAGRVNWELNVCCGCSVFTDMSNITLIYDGHCSPSLCSPSLPRLNYCNLFPVLSELSSSRLSIVIRYDDENIGRSANGREMRRNHVWTADRQGALYRDVDCHRRIAQDFWGIVDISEMYMPSLLTTILGPLPSVRRLFSCLLLAHVPHFLQPSPVHFSP
jgi:hypothetical protein